MTTHADLMAERNDALRRLDVEWAREQIPASHAPSSNFALLVGLHKARVECTDIEAPLRHASREWLVARGFSRRGGLPWPPAGELPE
ncbi:hypothetical protein [Hydrogenophaga sp.]|uniref:hypothetical protein n=1 Tax=Hydrogenophaga sp. TaxID=1904254 RepID=UPI0025C5B0F7|nr:hypothetical protein [Hydrogenophaga sp.]MBT9467114.1 hypothetical protein [Hydrogenophaga sp.]